MRKENRKSSLVVRELQNVRIYSSTIIYILYPNNSRDVYLYIYSVSAYMG